MIIRYSFLGSSASASGSLVAGFLSTALVEHYNMTELNTYRIVFVEYGVISVILMMLVCLLSKKIERDFSQLAAKNTSPAGVHSTLPLSKVNVDQDKDDGADTEAQPLLFYNDNDGSRASEHAEISNSAGRVSVTGRGEGNTLNHSLNNTAAPAAAATINNMSTFNVSKDSVSDSGREPAKNIFGLSAKSRRTVIHLALLFATDAFGSGMITGTLLAYYFQVMRWSFLRLWQNILNLFR